MGLKRIVPLGEGRQEDYEEWQRGYNYAKWLRAKNRVATPEEEATYSLPFKQGYRKGLNEAALSEGPMDFMRGMASATGQKVMQSRPVQAVKKQVGDVVQAGRTASQVGDMSKLVIQLAQLAKTRQQLKAKLQSAQVPGQEQQAAPAQQPAQQQRPAAVPPNATPAAFRTTEKPKGRMGQHGFEYTFNSFMQDVYGSEQLNEGVWDFVKGAGQAAGGKIADKLQQTFASRGAWLTNAVGAGKDIVNAGRQASMQGDLKKAQAQLQQVEQQMQALLKQIVASLKQMGDAAPNAVAQIVRGLPEQEQRAMAQLINSNMNKGA